MHSPDLLINTNSGQSLRLRSLELVLSEPKPGLDPHNTTHKIRVADRVRLCTFNVDVCLVWPTFFVKKPRQSIMNPESLVVPVENRCNLEGYVEVVDRFFHLTLGATYKAKDAVAMTEQESTTIAGEEIDGAVCDFFCSSELFVVV